MLFRSIPAAKLGPDGHIDRNQLPSIQLMWQPWAGLDLGGVLDQPMLTSQDAENEDVLLRVIGAIEGRMYLNALSKPIGIKDLTFPFYAFSLCSRYLSRATP